MSFQRYFRAYGEMRELLTLSEFWDVIADGPVVVDFTAQWCGPCCQIAPKVVELAKENRRVTFVKVDVDRARRIAEVSEVRAMPTFHVYKEGKLFETVVGANLPALKKSISKIVLDL